MTVCSLAYGCNPIYITDPASDTQESESSTYDATKDGGVRPAKADAAVSGDDEADASVALPGSKPFGNGGGPAPDRDAGAAGSAAGRVAQPPVKAGAGGAGAGGRAGSSAAAGSSAGAGGGGGGVPKPPMTPMPGVAIRGLENKCVDVAGNMPVDGAQIQLWPCNGVPGQAWSFGADGTVRAHGKCLDIQWSAFKDGTQLHLWECNGTDAQRWAICGQQLVSVAAARCVDVTNSGSDGTILQLWHCTHAPNQTWNLPVISGAQAPVCSALAPA
jgi:hypothetical protein